MKKIRDNKLYVNLEDMIYLGLASKVKDYKKSDGLIEIDDVLTINYILFSDDIYDYDYINSLSMEEVRNMIIKLEESIFFYEHQYLNLFLNSNIVEKEKIRRINLKKYRYQQMVLNHYLIKNNKEYVYKLGGNL